MATYVNRYVVTIPCKDGVGRTLMRPAQGRFTYATPEEAQAWIDGYLANNSQAVIDEVGRDVQVRPCKCYPEHFDPMEVWFDMPETSAQYLASFRSKTTHGTDKQVIDVWPGQTPEEVAERLAQGYGATVDSMQPLNS